MSVYEALADAPQTAMELAVNTGTSIHYVEMELSRLLTAGKVDSFRDNGARLWQVVA